MCVCVCIWSFCTHKILTDTTAGPVAKWYLNRACIGAVYCENAADGERDRRIWSSDARRLLSQLLETHSLRLSPVVEERALL